MQSKKVKFSLVSALALILVWMFAAPLAAAETFSLTIDNAQAGHTYEAYQIFTGDLSQGDDNNLILANIQWGQSIKETSLAGLGNAAQKAATLKNEADAKAFAADIAADLKETPFAVSSRNEEASNYTISGLPAGYYLIKDKNGTLTNEHDSYTSYILKVSANESVRPKSDVPTFVKKVKDINDTETDVYSAWMDSADHDIGDKVPFKLEAKLPSNYSAYETYKLTFTDKEAAGLSFDKNSVSVWVQNGENSVQIKQGFEIVTEGLAAGVSFEVRFANLKTVQQVSDNSIIRVEYLSELNENAVLGEAGNPNEAYLTFSNNPNNVQGGELGKTPNDKVIVFTYQTVVNKVDEQGDPLAGAEFTLQKKVYKANSTEGEYDLVTVAKHSTSSDTAFVFRGLDDGDYVLTETSTPQGYNSIEPIEFTITAEHQAESDNPQLISLSGNKADGSTEAFTVSKNDGELAMTVENHRGTILPGTGGIGTTIFYVVGGTLMTGALVLLAVKKHSGKKEN